MAQGAQEVWVTVNGERFLVKVEDLDQRPVVAFIEGSRFEVEIEEGAGGSGVLDMQVGDDTVTHSIPAGTRCEVTAPMPGDIIQVHVKPGQPVKAGDPLCILDAMKMKNTIHAPQDGVIVEIIIAEGTSVEYGAPLFRLG
jgi:biotin carboxyl carrier protein